MAPPLLFVILSQRHPNPRATLLSQKFCHRQSRNLGIFWRLCGIIHAESKARESRVDVIS